MTVPESSCGPDTGLGLASLARFQQTGRRRVGVTGGGGSQAL